MKSGYNGETLVEDNIMEFRFEDLKKDVPVELSRYIINHVVEASGRNILFNAWEANVLKGHTRATRRLYLVR